VTNQKLFWDRPLVSNLLTAGAYLVPLIVLFGGLPRRLTTVETNQRAAQEKLNAIAEGVAKIQGALEERRQRVADAR